MYFKTLEIYVHKFAYFYIQNQQNYQWKERGAKINERILHIN